MRQCFKNIPAKFQSRPTFLAGFFSKRVTDDDDRRKTFFLASCGENSSLICRVVTMEYRTSDRGMCVHFRDPVSPHSSSASFLQLSSSKFLDFSMCFLSFELLCLTMSSPSDFSFKAKEQLFEQTFYHLIFPVRGKSIVDSLWKSWSPRLNIGDRVHELPFPSRHTVMHTVIMSCQFTRNDSLTWLVKLERW